MLLERYRSEKLFKAFGKRVRKLKGHEGKKYEMEGDFGAKKFNAAELQGMEDFDMDEMSFFADDAALAALMEEDFDDYAYDEAAFEKEMMDGLFDMSFSADVATMLGECYLEYVSSFFVRVNCVEFKAFKSTDQ